LVISPPTRVAALAALARALLARGKVEAAAAAGREAVELLDSLRQVEEGEGAARLARAETLWATGEREGAAAALQIAHARVLARADAIQRPELRRSYLEHVPENARLFELMREWRISPGAGTGSEAPSAAI
jgi:hypothetical protein